jgi:hypothetical protein
VHCLTSRECTNRTLLVIQVNSTLVKGSRWRSNSPVLRDSSGYNLLPPPRFVDHRAWVLINIFNPIYCCLFRLIYHCFSQEHTFCWPVFHFNILRTTRHHFLAGLPAIFQYTSALKRRRLNRYCSYTARLPSTILIPLTSINYCSV